MKLDFNFPITGLDGKPISDANAGKLLANILVSQPSGEVVKLFDWALKMYNGQPIYADRADQQFLIKFITDSQQITLLAKKQLLDVLEGKSNGVTVLEPEITDAAG